MVFSIAKPRTVENFVARLTEVERMKIRMSSPAQLEHLLHTAFTSDMIDLPKLLEAAKLVKEDFAARSKETHFGLTWRF